MSTNEPDVIEIRISVLRMFGLIIASVLLTAFGAAMALDLFLGEQVGIVYRAIGILGVLFFGVGTIARLWRLLAGRDPVLTISPEGIRDTRIAPDPIPWSAIRNVSTWEHSGQRILVLDVDPAVERRLHLSTIARLTRSANRKLGADGLCVATHGLKIRHDELFDLIRQRLPLRPT